MTSKDDDGGASSEKGQLGPRGEAALAPFVPYLGNFFACLGDACDVETNPKGGIPLCAAENKLVLDMVQARMKEKAATVGFDNLAGFTYNDLTGMPPIREAVAGFLERHFLKKSGLSSTIRPNHVALGTGCTALLNHLFFLLGNTEGDCCLIPRPYTASFDNDVKVMANVKPFGVAQANPATGPTVVELQVAYDQAVAEKLNPKFLLLNNPNNPLGTVYSAETMRQAIDWAASMPNDMHVVCDEIYALSLHEEDDKSFESVISILDNQLSTNVHFLWAMSKDFGISGFRCGVLYSQNEKLLGAVSTLSIFTCVSGPIQFLMADMLSDEAFVDHFFQESRRRMRASYEICIDAIKAMGLPFVPATSGFFVYVDFRKLLPEEPTFEMERRLGDLFYRHAKIVLATGESHGDAQPGWFRICYTWVTPAVLGVAMERLRCFVEALQPLVAKNGALPTDGDEEAAAAFANVL